MQKAIWPMQRNRCIYGLTLAVGILSNHKPEEVAPTWHPLPVAVFAAADVVAAAVVVAVAALVHLP